MPHANLAYETCQNKIVVMQKLFAFKCDKCRNIFKDSYIFADFPEYWMNVVGEKSLKIEIIPKEVTMGMSNIGVHFKLFCKKYKLVSFDK